MSFDYKDKNIIVTGGTRGIGKEITKEFLKAGAIVIATYKSDDQKALEFKNECGELSSRLHLRKFDVSVEEEVKAFYSWFQEQFNSLYALINNSGIRKDNLVASMLESEFQSVMDTNLKGNFLMCRESILLFMQNRFGRIINMSSVGAHHCFVGQSNYSASKAAQIAFTKCLAKEVGKKGITVNSVSPGFIDTELINDLKEDVVKEYKKSIPLKRFGTGKEVADLVLFLCSENAGYITGSNIEIAGGL